VYVMSVSMSDDDDSCTSLIDSVTVVFDKCGVRYHQPFNEHFVNLEDYKNHAEEVWNDLHDKARSKRRVVVNLSFEL